MADEELPENLNAPLPVFRFRVDFTRAALAGGDPGGGAPLCSGAFSECTGLEATQEPKVIKEGGRNYGAAQRAGQVTFGTVILKRGMTATRDLWAWFDLVTKQAKYAYRLTARVTMFGPPREAGGEPQAILAWELARALPVKFKSADLNARGTEVGVEELHLAHEGMTLLEQPDVSLWQT